MTRPIASLLVLASAQLAWAGAARAVPGPDSVAVVANGNVPESVALALRYADERDLPPGQVCLLDLPDTIDIGLDQFRTEGLEAIDACLSASGALDRTEAVLLVRGLPLRVTIPLASGDQRVSFAAAVHVWRSETDDGTPLLGQAPGFDAICSGMRPCYMAQWRNPFEAGPFEPGFARDTPGIRFRLMLVTKLHGFNYDHAERLLDSALMAETDRGANGEFLFMEGRNLARSGLDFEFAPTMTALRDRGYTDVTRVPFDPDLTGRTLAGLVVGADAMGTTIEGNVFTPGSLVDNLTSFGAVPENFDPTMMDRQVSVARWVAMGVAGVHGTTDEPLSSVFPSRRFLVDYVDGSTLAEAYHRRLPFLYWRNLVLGDPMLAPYAVRPEVRLDGVSNGDTVDDARRVTVTTTDREGFGVDSIVVLLGDEEIARTDADTLELCLDVPDGVTAQLLVVAQKADDGTTTRAIYRPKGWVAIDVNGAAGTSECADPDAGPPPAPDSGPPAADAGVTPPPADDGGCGCAIPSSPARPGRWALLFGLGVLLGGRFRRPRGRPR